MYESIKENKALTLKFCLLGCHKSNEVHDRQFWRIEFIWERELRILRTNHWKNIKGGRKLDI